MQLKYVYLTVGICVLMLFSLPVQAEDICNKIQTRYKEISSFKTSFIQKMTNAASGNTEERKGVIYFQKPHFVKWQTKNPEKEVLLVNNSTVWQYIPQEKVAYKFSLQDKFKSKTMIEFITGEVNIEKDFQVEKLDKNEKGWMKLKLIPKDPEFSLKMAYLWVEPENGIIRRIKIRNFVNNENTLTFRDIQLSPDISQDLFIFQPSGEIEVRDNT